MKQECLPKMGGVEDLTSQVTFNDTANASCVRYGKLVIISGQYQKTSANNPVIFTGAPAPAKAPGIGISVGGKIINIFSTGYAVLFGSSFNGNEAYSIAYICA